MAKLDITLAANSLDEIATSMGVDPKVARAILLTENHGQRSVDTGTVSPAGAQGIMQVMPGTWRGLVANGLLSPTADQNDPATQLRAGVAAIKDGMNSGVKTPVEQAVYYNGGPTQLANYRAGRPLAPETANYLKNFGANMGMQAIDAAATPVTPGSPTMNLNVQRTGSTTTTHSRNIPAALSADIFDAASAYNGLSTEMTAQLRALSAQVLPNAAAQKAASDAEVAAKVAQTNAERDKTLAVDDNQHRILEAFGVDLNNPDNIIAKNKLIATSAHNERAMMQDQITALSSKSPMSDPVGWLMDSIKAAPIINRHNALLQMENSANATILQNQQEATAQAAIQPANIRSATNAKAIADANLAIADGQAKKAAIDGAARGELARNALGLLQVGGADVANKLKIADMFSPTTGVSVSSSEGDSPEKDMGLGLVNAVANGLGMGSFTKATFNAYPKDVRDKLLEAAQNGQIGKTPGTAVALLHAVGGNNLGKTLQNAPMANEFLQGIVSAGQSEFDTINSSPNPPPGVKAAIARMRSPIDQLAYGVDHWTARKELELKTNNMADIPRDNPYRFEAVTAAADPALQNNPVSKIIIDSAKTGQRVDDQWLLSSMAAKIATKEMTSGEAASALATFYSEGFKRQFTNKGMGIVGFKPLSTYPSSNKLFGVTFSSVDMMNPVSLENYFIKEISSALGKGATMPAADPNVEAAQMRSLR